MSANQPISALAPFRIRAFRFQWPADLATSWAFEMETIMLGWYILVETRSVLLLTLFASMQYVGTLIAPFIGVMADRLGTRNVLCAMRGFYCLLAVSLMTFTLLGLLTPLHVFVIAGLMGLVRPSDIGMRVALVGDTMPPAQLLGAMGIQRTTQDSAKVAGALSGAALVAALGMGAAYVVVASLYASSVLLTLKAGSRSVARKPQESSPDAQGNPSPWRDLKQGLRYVWDTPRLLAVMCLAFLLNLTAFPIFNGLLPYVAKDVFLTDQTGLGYLVAGAASGSLVASLVLSRHGIRFRVERMVMGGTLGWYGFLLVFANVPYHLAGIAILFLAGLAQSVSMVPMSAMLLRSTDEQFRSRVQGIRMLAIYGNMPGLLIAGQLIPLIGYRITASLYCIVGVALSVWICWRWRSHFWHRRGMAS